MREELKGLDFSKFIKIQYEESDFEKRKNTFITGVIDLEKLCEVLGKKKIKCVRRKVLFVKKKFCELAIFDLGDNYLVEAAEFRSPKLKIGKDKILEHTFLNVYITTEMRFFLMDKNDSYIKVLLRKISDSLENQVITMIDFGIYNMYLSDEVTSYKKYVLKEAAIVKPLFVFLKNKPKWEAILDEYYSELPIKVSSVRNMKSLEFVTKDMINENEEYYTKEDILNEKLTIIKIKNPTPWSVFCDTILGKLFSPKNILPVGTEIYVKNVEENVFICFDDRGEEENLRTSVLMITSIKVIVHQPKKTKEGLPLRFNEREIKFKDNLLLEMLKKMLYKNINWVDDYVGAKKVL